MADDKTLLQKAQTFDEEALAEIFDRYYVPLYRFIYHHVRHVETAQDMASEVFQRFLAQLREGHGPRNHLKAWLFRVAHNLIVDESRRLVHRDHQTLDDKLPAEHASMDEQAHQAILAEAARDALHLLTPKQRSIVILKYLHGMDNAEVARIVGLPITAVKALQHRALGTLRRSLAGSAPSLAKESAL